MSHIIKRQKTETSSGDSPDESTSPTLLVEIVSLTWKLIFEKLVALQAYNKIDQDDILASCRMLLMLKCMTCRFYVERVQTALYLFDNIRGAIQLIKVLMTGEIRRRFGHINLYFEYRYLMKQFIYRENEGREELGKVLTMPLADYEKFWRQKEEEYKGRMAECSQLLESRREKSREKKRLKALWKLEEDEVLQSSYSKTLGVFIDELGKIDNRLRVLIRRPQEFEVESSCNK